MLVGQVGVALYDGRSGRSFTYNTFRNQTLSTIKVVILATVCRRAQERGVALTANQKYLAGRMIQYSDNNATDQLLAQVGVANVQRVAKMLGMYSTYVQGQSSGWWGYSTTVPMDEVVLENALVWGGTPVLTAAHRGYIRSLMRMVTPAQRWGVYSANLPALADWGVKCGWGPMSGGYRLNSMGYVYGNGRNYTATFLSRSPNGFYYGQTTLNRLGRIVYDAMARPLS